MLVAWCVQLACEFYMSLHTRICATLSGETCFLAAVVKICDPLRTSERFSAQRHRRISTTDVVPMEGRRRSAYIVIAYRTDHATVGSTSYASRTRGRRRPDSELTTAERLTSGLERRTQTSCRPIRLEHQYATVGPKRPAQSVGALRQGERPRVSDVSQHSLPFKPAA